MQAYGPGARGGSKILGVTVRAKSVEKDSKHLAREFGEIRAGGLCTVRVTTYEVNTLRLPCHPGTIVSGRENALISNAFTSANHR